MDRHETGQVVQSAAQVYETFFVPALFAEWCERVLATVNGGPGQHVLDVACGTGVLARAAAARVGTTGSVVGLDVNEDMLAEAKRQAPRLTWRHGAAESLPFASAQFDAVVSQFGLMFFADRPAAIQEMMRVLRPGGRLAVAVWDTLDNTPGYASMVALLQRLFGDEAAAALQAPYCLGDVAKLRALFAAAGVREPVIETHVGTARFPSIAAWVHTDIRGWTLADLIDDAAYARLLQEAEQALVSFTNGDGRVSFAAPAHIVSAVKR